MYYGEDYRFVLRHPMDKMDERATLILKTFQSEMKLRSRIPKSVVEKYKDELCFMVDTNFTYMEAVTPRVIYVDPLGYDITEEIIESYVQKILSADLDPKIPRFGTYKENMKLSYQTKLEKSIRKKVDN